MFWLYRLGWDENNTKLRMVFCNWQFSENIKLKMTIIREIHKIGEIEIIPNSLVLLENEKLEDFSQVYLV